METNKATQRQQEKAMNNSKTFFAVTIDPLHIGAGGYRLGRVDNTIVREPGSGLPKLPGTSISGVCRNYAIYGLENGDKDKAEKCAMGKDLDPKEKNNCGQCVICKTFGYANGKTQKSQIGKVKFFDGTITAFPVSTLAGPVWVTTASILKGLGQENVKEPGREELFINFDLPGQKKDKQKLNLGWLYLPCKKKDFSLPDEAKNGPGAEIAKRLVVAPEWLFPEIVNANLEVRTSVSIDFETGAADSGKLFTYEAIPRAALVQFDVVVDEYRCATDPDADKVWNIVQKGMALFEPLGLGGMNTRGFGRLKVLNLESNGGQ